MTRLIPRAAEPTCVAKAIAYYRHASPDQPKNSVAIQHDHIRAWATQRQITIVHEFADRGWSGLAAEGRPAFMDMMRWVRTHADFTLVLVLDVSRWGRFQDPRLLAHCESVCARFGKIIVFINQHDDAPAYPLVVSLKSWRSARYCRAFAAQAIAHGAKVARHDCCSGRRPSRRPGTP